MGDEEGSGAGYQVQYLDGDCETTTWLSRAGEARVMYPDGNVYEGMFNALKQRHGRGTYTYAAATGGEDEDDDEEEGGKKEAVPARYSGDFHLGKKHGQGTFRYPDGSIYNGTWVDNTRHGKGTYTYANGDVYSGRWLSGKKEGVGTYRFKSTGAQLVGTWQNDVFVNGKSVMSDNSSFHGRWKNSTPQGKGIFYLASGNRVEGSFVGANAGAEEVNDEEGDAAAAPSWETRSIQTAEIAPADLLRYHEVDPQDAVEKAAEEQAAQEALKLAAEKQEEEVAKEDA